MSSVAAEKAHTLLAAAADFGLAAACILQLTGAGGELAWAPLVLVACDELGARLRYFFFRGGRLHHPPAGDTASRRFGALLLLLGAAFLFWGAVVFTFVGFLALLLVTPPTAGWAACVIGKSLWWGWANRPRSPAQYETVAAWARRDSWLRWTCVAVTALATWGGGSIAGYSGPTLEHLIAWVGPSGYFALQGLQTLFHPLRADNPTRDH